MKRKPTQHHGPEVNQMIPQKPTVEERLLRLREAGVISWSGKHLSAEVPRVPLEGRETVTDLLLKDRD